MEATTSFLLQRSLPYLLIPNSFIISCRKDEEMRDQNPKCYEKSPKLQLINSNCSGRRVVVGVAISTIAWLATETTADGFDLDVDLRMVAPEQSMQEAESGIKRHAQALLDVKGLIDLGTWREVQKAIRESSSSLKQDVYTIIQHKPAHVRPNLRKLYSTLFNNVSRVCYVFFFIIYYILRKIMCYVPPYWKMENLSPTFLF